MDSKEILSMGGITVVFIIVLSFFPMVGAASTVKYIIHDDGPFGPNDPYGPGIVKSTSECEEVVEAEDGTFSGEVYSFPLAEGDSNEQVLLMGYQSSVTVESEGKADVLYIQHTRSDYTDGQADYYVDGQYVTTVNTRMRGTWYVEIAGLKNKPHTVTVFANPTQVTVDYVCFGDKKANRGRHVGQRIIFANRDDEIRNRFEELIRNESRRADIRKRFDELMGANGDGGEAGRAIEGMIKDKSKREEIRSILDELSADKETVEEEEGDSSI